MEFSRNIEKWKSYKDPNFFTFFRRKWINSVTLPFFNVFGKFHFWEVGQMLLSKNYHKKMSFLTLEKHVYALNLPQNLKFNTKNLLLWPKICRLGKILKRCILSYIFTFWQKNGKKACSTPWLLHIHENHTRIGTCIFLSRSQKFFSTWPF